MKNQDKLVIYNLPDREETEEGYFQIVDLETR